MTTVIRQYKSILLHSNYNGTFTIVYPDVIYGKGYLVERIYKHENTAFNKFKKLVGKEKAKRQLTLKLEV